MYIRGRLLYDFFMMKQGITAEELIKLGKSHGYPLTHRKLQGWHKEDLLPRPIVTRLGKGKGTASHYPIGTNQQLMSLCRLHYGGGPYRRYDPLRIALWCEGFQIPINCVKASAINLLKPMLQTWQNNKTRGRDKLDIAEAFAKLIMGATFRRGTTTSRISKRFRKEEDLQSFWIVLCCLILNDKNMLFDGDDQETELGELTPNEILERGLDLQAARTVSVAGMPPWLTGELADGLELLSAIEPTMLITSIEKATEAELIQARQDWLELSTLHTIAKVFERIGIDIFRKELIESVTTKAKPAIQVSMIGFLLKLRKIKNYDANLDQFFEALQNNRFVYESYEKLMAYDKSLIPVIGIAVQGGNLNDLSSDLIEKLQIAFSHLGLIPNNSGPNQD